MWLIVVVVKLNPLPSQPDCLFRNRYIVDSDSIDISIDSVRGHFNISLVLSSCRVYSEFIKL